MEIYQINHIQKVSAIFGIAGPIVNVIVFTILGFLYPGYNPVSQFISELATPEAPHNIFMNIFGFVIFGLYLIFFGIGLYLSVKRHFLISISMILFIISGIFILTLSFFPCDLGCRDVTFLGIGHNVLIKFPSITMPAAIILSLYPLWKDSNWKNYWWIFLVLIGVFLVIYLILSLTTNLYLINGLIQRLGLFVPIAWVFLMSIRLYRLIT
jgi:hypothetical membrane protein